MALCHALHDGGVLAAAAKDTPTRHSEQDEYTANNIVGCFHQPPPIILNSEFYKFPFAAVRSRFTPNNLKIEYFAD